jgi:hypothetical protein
MIPDEALSYQRSAFSLTYCFHDIFPESSKLNADRAHQEIGISG